MIRRSSESTAAITAALAVLLASSALTRCYTELTFALPVVSAVVVAFVLGWIGRRLDVPAGLAPAVSFVGFVEYLTIAYFRGDAFLGFVPTPEVFRAAGRVIREAAKDINQLSAPVVPTRALIFITVAGVFAVAVVVDLIALRLRRPVLAGLPLLALFVIPSSLSPTGAGWLAFSLAAAGFLALLTTEGRDRVHRWGRRLSANRNAADDGYRRPVARAARGIGAAAVGFALVVPGLTPGLENGLLTGTGASSGSGAPGKGKGNSNRTTISPVVELRKNLAQSRERELIRVTTEEPQYLRMAALDEFTGDAWRVSKASRPRSDATKPIGPPPGLAEGIERHNVTSEILISNQLDGRFLPVPYSPVKIDGLKGTWRYDDANRTIESTNKSIRGTRAIVESTVVTPDPMALNDDLPYPDEIQQFTKLESSKVDASVVAQAKELTADATTDWGRVVALQNYFSRDGGFTYSTTAPAGTGGNALKAFLRDKIGYCEQYAAAMAVMVRAIGMPSRVVIGFTTGTKKAGYYSITNKDAHAWPEVYFPTVGWVRFEPTPAGAGPAVVPPAVTSIVPTAEPDATPTPSASATPSMDPDALAAMIARQQDDIDRMGRRGSDNNGFTTTERVNRRPLLIAFLVLLAALIPVVPAVWRSRLRRRDRRTAVVPRQRSHVAWRHVHDDAYDLGFGWPVSASPRVAGRSLIAAARLDGDAEAAVRRLSVAEENARYAPDSYVGGSAPDYDSDVAVIREALLAGVPTRDRLRAIVFPRSTLRVISSTIHVRSAAVASATARFVDRLIPARLRPRSG